MELFTKEDRDKVILYCAGQGRIPPMGGDIGLDEKMYEQLKSYMINLGYIRYGSEGVYILTDFGRTIASQGGIIAMERKVEEDQRKADTLHDASVRAADATIVASQATAASVTISKSVADSTKRTNLFIGVTAFIAFIALVFQILNFNQQVKQIHLQEQELQQEKQSQTNQKKLDDISRLSSSRQDSIISLNVDNLKLRLRFDSALNKNKADLKKQKTTK